MTTIRYRILAYLAVHPEVANYVALAEALRLNARRTSQQPLPPVGRRGPRAARSARRDAAQLRVRIPGQRARWRSRRLRVAQSPPARGTGRATSRRKSLSICGRTWLYHCTHGRHGEQGDRQGIEARDADGSLWVTVKGYPAGTPRTHPSIQAGHWFKQAVFDVIALAWREPGPRLAIALPDFPRYRKLAQKIAWSSRFAI